MVIPSGWRDIYVFVFDWSWLSALCLHGESLNSMQRFWISSQKWSVCVYLCAIIFCLWWETQEFLHTWALQQATERPSHLSTTNPNVPETWEPITTTLFQQTPSIPKQDHYKYQLLIPHGPPPWLTVQISFINGQCGCQCKSSFWCHAVLSL